MNFTGGGASWLHQYKLQPHAPRSGERRLGSNVPTALYATPLFAHEQGLQQDRGYRGQILADGSGHFRRKRSARRRLSQDVATLRQAVIVRLL